VEEDRSIHHIAWEGRGASFGASIVGPVGFSMIRMKTFHNFMCGVHPVRVIYGEGEVLYLAPQTTVQEVLQSYPHHFVCQPGGMIGSTFSSSEEEEQQQQQGGGTGNQMLSLDTELESGCIYFLLPLPKLFPAAPSSAPSCTCFSHLLVDCEHPSSEKKNKNSSNKSKYPPRTTTSSSPLKVFRSPHRIGGLSSPFRSLKPIRSLSPFHKRSGSKSRVLPESNLYSGGGNNGDNIADLLQQRGKNCQWRPRLGCISEEEDDLELLALEELKNNNGVVVRQQLTTTVCNKATSTTPHSSGSHGSPLSHRLNSLTVTGTSAFG